MLPTSLKRIALWKAQLYGHREVIKASLLGNWRLFGLGSEIAPLDLPAQDLTPLRSYSPNTSYIKETTMELSYAQEIVDEWFKGRKIDAIKLLRNETSLGLKEAKDYLDVSRDPEATLRQLCEDYVQDPRELLQRAIARRDSLNREIEILESQIEDHIPERTYTVKDMEAAYEAGRLRVMWEEGYGGDFMPVFRDFIREYKG